MVDLKPTIIAKSDQLNADDLIGGSITVTVTNVASGGADQPILINYEGDNQKPYKPCKSMRRVLVGAWGSDGKAYIGRAMTLYRDDTVKWAGAPVGGIRISHLSHITEPLTLSLGLTRGKKTPVVIQPLKNSAGKVECSVPTQDKPKDSRQTTDGGADGKHQMLFAEGKSQSFPDLNSMKAFVVKNLNSFSSAQKIDEFLKRNANPFYEYSCADTGNTMNEIYALLEDKKKEFLNV